MAKGICHGGAEQRAPYPIFACIVELFCLSGAVAAAASHRDVNKVTASKVFFFLSLYLFLSFVSLPPQTDCGVERETPQVIVAVPHFLVLAGRNSA